MRARVPVVIDHMGRAPTSLGTGHAGIHCLLRLMRDGPVWVKLSGVANISDDAPTYPAVRSLHDTLLKAAPCRLLWGSDWPHTRPAGPRPDTAALVRLFRAWAPEPDQDRIGSAAAMALYRFSL